MGGSRNRIKKALIPSPSKSPDNTVADEELMDDLFAQLDSKDETVHAESANVLQEMSEQSPEQSPEQTAKKDAKNRFKARQAKKAAAVAEANYTQTDAEADAKLEREAKEEEAAISRICDELDLKLYEINPDGHCLFAAIADQLALLGILSPSQASYAITRNAAAKYIYSHPNDFLPFLPSTTGEDGQGAGDAGFMSPKEFEAYCAAIRDTGVWGGEPEILALSRAFNVPIHVVQSGVPPVVIHNPLNPADDKDIHAKHVVQISYHRRMYGLGEHYNSLRPKSSLLQMTDAIQKVLS